MLPHQCHLRPATAEDLGAIRRLVFSAKLDPTQLRWQQFWVVEHHLEAGEPSLIACGQLRSFHTAQELGSLVVQLNWRGQGIGCHLTQVLIDQATQPLYLECLGRALPGFYSPFGFQPVAWKALPKSLQLKFAPAMLGRKLGLPLQVMTRKAS